jgi:hypothetical protein
MATFETHGFATKTFHPIGISFGQGLAHLLDKWQNKVNRFNRIQH